MTASRPSLPMCQREVVQAGPARISHWHTRQGLAPHPVGSRRLYAMAVSTGTGGACRTNAISLMLEPRSSRTSTTSLTRPWASASASKARVPPPTCTTGMATTPNRLQALECQCTQRGVERRSRNHPGSMSRGRNARAAPGPFTPGSSPPPPQRPTDPPKSEDGGGPTSPPPPHPHAPQSKTVCWPGQPRPRGPGPFG
jgi:hypothetical protein